MLLVDATRGVCHADRKVLQRLRQANVPVLACLTKADLLTPRDLAISYELTRRALSSRPGYAGGDLPMSSARNAAGIQELWRRVREGALEWSLRREDGEEREVRGEDSSEADGYARMRRRRRRRRTTMP